MYILINFLAIPLYTVTGTFPRNLMTPCICHLYFNSKVISVGIAFQSLEGQISYLNSLRGRYTSLSRQDQEGSPPKSKEVCPQVTVSSQERLGIPFWMAESLIYEILTHKEQL